MLFSDRLLARDEDLRRIRRIGRKAWKGESGYHGRSLGETAISRMKTIFGGVSSRRLFSRRPRWRFGAGR